MADEYGTVVVAVPSDVGSLPIKVEGGPHITLAYFGDTPLSDHNLRSLSTSVSQVVDVINDIFEDHDNPGIVALPDKFESFGKDQDAKVVTFDPIDNRVLLDIREAIVSSLTTELRTIFEKEQTWDTYRPHMTLGYSSQGYQDQLLKDASIPFEINLDTIEIWNGSNKVIFRLPSQLMHYGTPRHSGRYPWGSGDDPYQSSRSFLAYMDELTKRGMTAKEIAAYTGMSMRELRDIRSISVNNIRKENIRTAIKLKEKQMSNVAIGKQMGISEGSVRNLLASSEKEKANSIDTTVDALKKSLERTRFLDVGAGTEYHMNISQTKLNAALTKMKMEGYRVDTIKVEQLGTGHETTMKVLSPPGTEYKDIIRNKTEIGTVAAYSDNNGDTFHFMTAPKHIAPSRVGVRYAEEGGTEADGVIYIRRGVPDISLGNSRYAQVRIAVGDSHYLKGMAVYSDDLPKGVDLLFNTNKSNTGNDLDAMKELVTEVDPVTKTTLPFKTVTKPKYYIDKNGKEQQSYLNIVNEEGDWYNWSKSLSSQMLSKQSATVAKQQLDLSYSRRQDEFNEISNLTNPTIKKQLLLSFADNADSAAVSLKAAALPRTANHVILPINSLKETEIYAPKYNNGETVALIRHPHGGPFEIPILTVNNRNAEGKRTITNMAVDAVGINHKVAERLSGADFDGDTVLVIPNDKGYIKNQAPLEGLNNFNPNIYAVDHETITPLRKQNEMGNISNLITDMTIKGANSTELARAVRHSMVVIDAEKHNLDYKQSAIDNGIAQLKIKYQGGANKGASTLVSQASSKIRVEERKPRRMQDGGPIDPLTGEKKYQATGRTYVNKKGIEKHALTTSTRMAETSDANTLSSGRPIEQVYANYANSMKALANTARKEALATPNLVYSPVSKKTYAPQVSSLNHKLNTALKNAPLERRAQLLADTTFKEIRKNDPDMSADKAKTIKSKLLTQARNSIGAGKQRIDITEKEWEAIQAGAISNNKLEQILRNADLTQVKEYATPRATTSISEAKESRILAMLNVGYTQAEIAKALGVSVSSVVNIAKR